MPTTSDHRPWRLAPIIAGLMCAVVACGSPADPPGDPAGSGDPATGGTIPSCADVPMISAPDAAYRDAPIYVGNEQPTEALLTWAQAKPGFEELWIDRDHHGWVTIGFSQDAAARQAELEAEFPGVGVVAVEVPRTAAELEALQAQVHELLPPDVAGGSAAMTTHGVVMIMIGVATPARVAAVDAAFAGEPVCIDGTDPALAPASGPQAQAGDGWRLLATEPTGHAYRTGIAFDDPSLKALWAISGVAAPVPDIDWQREVVVWFGAVFGSSCPDLRLDGVVLDDPRRIIHADIVLVDPPVACTADANPRAYLVAVDRARLPAPTFAIQLTAEEPPAGVPEERTLVDADLRAPGSIADPSQIHGDPMLRPGPDIRVSGDVIETGFPTAYRMSTHCGVEWLGELNGVTWRTTVEADVVDYLPPAWAPVVAMDETIVLDIVMSEGPDPVVTATANGVSLVYRPANGPAPGCD